MNTEDRLFFWVEGMTRDADGGSGVLRGQDFVGGLSSRVKNMDGPLWLASARGTTPLKGRVELWHVARRGWELHLVEGSIESTPCLLCADPTVRYVFCGRVLLKPQPLVDDLPGLIGYGMPLCGRDWLGIVRSLSDGFHLEAFARSDGVAVDGSTAYFPEWSDSLEDVDAFRVRVSVIR